MNGEEMFALNGFEAAHLLLTVVSIALSMLALLRGGDRRIGLAVIVAAWVIPVAGPMLAVAYGVNSLVRRRPQENS